MDPTRLASFDLGSFDPIARPARRRRPPGATAQKAPAAVALAPVAAAPAAPAAPAPDTAELREAVALLASQLGEAQAANAALAKRLDDHIDEPIREARQRAIFHHLLASRF